jgi:hypothetical protein
VLCQGACASYPHSYMEPPPLATEFVCLAHVTFSQITMHKGIFIVNIIQFESNCDWRRKKQRSNSEVPTSGRSAPDPRRWVPSCRCGTPPLKQAHIPCPSALTVAYV